MLLGTLQWALAVVIGLPCMLTAIIVLLPLSVPLYAAVLWRTRKIASGDLSARGGGAHPLECRPKGWVFCYVTLIALFWHWFIRVWAWVARPRVVFVVYHNTINTLGKFFCLHTGKVRRARARASAATECRQGQPKRTGVAPAGGRPKPACGAAYLIVGRQPRATASAGAPPTAALAQPLPPRRPPLRRGPPNSFLAPVLLPRHTHTLPVSPFPRC